MIINECRNSILEQAVIHQSDTASRAALSNLHWVLCLWESPLCKGLVDKRVAYFEDILEAENVQNNFVNMYKKYQFPFYIVTSYGFIEDGGLFND